MHCIELPPRLQSARPVRRVAGSLGRNFCRRYLFNYPVKTALKLSVILFTASWFFAGCATAPGRSVAREYRLVHGVTDAGGVAAFEEKLNIAGREGFAIHSTTLLPKEENQRQQALIILERPAR